MKKSEIIIRKMVDEDLIHVSELISSGYKKVAGIEGYGMAETERLIAERGSSEAISRQCQKYDFWIATIENEVVGAIALSKNVLEKLYVDPKRDRNGFGTELFKWAENIISQAGYAEMVFGAFPGSVGFYMKMGAALTAEKIICTGPLIGHRIVLMCKPLRSASEK